MKNEKNANKHFCNNRLLAGFTDRYCCFFQGAMASFDNHFSSIAGKYFNSPESFDKAKMGAADLFFWQQ